MRKRILVTTMIVVLLAVGFPPTKQVDIEVKVKQHKEKPEPLPTQATWAEKKANKKMALAFAQAGWGWSKQQQVCLVKLFTQESRFDHLADNPESTAFGIGQVLSEKSRDPAIQILRAYKYIEHRYQTPCNAYNHHLRRNWY
jgi:hypothetical protein